MSRNGDIVGDIALWNLPYAEEFLKFKNVKVVALKREKAHTIASFEKWFGKWNHFPWADTETQVANGYKPNKRYDKCYQKFEFGGKTQLSIKDGAEKHYDSYYSKVERLAKKYPDRVKLLDTYEILNSNDAKKQLFTEVCKT